MPTCTCVYVSECWRVCGHVCPYLCFGVFCVLAFLCVSTHGFAWHEGLCGCVLGVCMDVCPSSHVWRACLYVRGGVGVYMSGCAHVGSCAPACMPAV